MMNSYDYWDNQNDPHISAYVFKETERTVLLGSALLFLSFSIVMRRLAPQTPETEFRKQYNYVNLLIEGYCGIIALKFVPIINVFAVMLFCN